MLVNAIVPMIAEEIERLRRIRAILVPLQDLTQIPKAARTRSEARNKELATAPVEPRSPEPAPLTITRLPSRKPRVHRLRLPQPVEQSAVLRGAIPVGPVVVHRRNIEPIEPTPEPVIEGQPGSFAALVRAAERELHAGA